MDIIPINKEEIIKGINDAEILPLEQDVFVIVALNKQVLKGTIKSFFYAKSSPEVKQLGTSMEDGIFYIVTTEKLDLYNIQPFQNLFIIPEKEMLPTVEAVRNKINQELEKGEDINYFKSLKSSLEDLVNPPPQKQEILNYNELFEIIEIQGYQDFVQDLNNIAVGVNFCLVPKKGVVKEIIVINSDCDCTHYGFRIEKYLAEIWNGEEVPRLRQKGTVSIDEESLRAMLEKDYEVVSFYTAMKEINNLKYNPTEIVGGRVIFNT